MPLLFKPNECYSQYSEDEHGPAAGLGLGLFIAAEIVAGHAGKIKVYVGAGHDFPRNSADFLMVITRPR
ncbi:sensor histidine kinase [Pseudomonas sp. GM55]|uniref:sensor histidine kinase n=1 Tax=Pseudomonas sp. GM55 TaxID=1144333 RepID=UPI00138B0452|nr:sensor histidine kinase [Pseudomonas sp. GM55]